MKANGQAAATHFRYFTGAKNGKMSMYGVRTETEGLLFRLEPVKVIRWLVDSGLVDDPGVDDPIEAQRWLFRVTDPIVDIFNAPDNQISRAVLGLTHSFAHRAMKALAARCGLNVDSLAEFLFPSNVSFLSMRTPAASSSSVDSSMCSATTCQTRSPNSLQSRDVCSTRRAGRVSVDLAPHASTYRRSPVSGSTRS